MRLPFFPSALLPSKEDKMRGIAGSKQPIALAILLYLQRAGFYWNILQTWFLPGLRAPDGRFLSRRGERNQRRAKGRGVSIRLSLWKPSPHRPGRGPRSPHLEAPPGANGIASADYTAHLFCAEGAPAEREGRCVCPVPNWEMFCEKSCAETTARSAASLIQSLFFVLHRPRRFSFSCEKKRRGVESRSQKRIKFAKFCKRKLLHAKDKNKKRARRLARPLKYLGVLINTYRPCRPCRDQREPVRGPRACRPRRPRWSAPWRQRMRRSAGRCG